jgi:small-conductance mechanosensitive channel
VVIVNEVDVSYGSDLDQVITILKDLAAANPWALKDPEPLVRVLRFAESGITMQLRTWVGNVQDRGPASSWTNLEIWRSFTANGVEIPFPQRVIHQKSTENRPAPPATVPVEQKERADDGSRNGDGGDTRVSSS